MELMHNDKNTKSIYKLNTFGDIIGDLRMSNGSVRVGLGPVRLQSGSDQVLVGPLIGSGRAFV